MIIKINNHRFKVKVVSKDKDIQNGMMWKSFDKGYNGMLFKMNLGEHCFWMKNCIIPLDIIFIEGNKIVEIFHNCERCKKEPCENYCSYGDLILEVQGGTCKSLNIKEGDKININ